jgi:hypothetical protein
MKRSNFIHAFSFKIKRMKAKLLTVLTVVALWAFAGSTAIQAQSDRNQMLQELGFSLTPPAAYTAVGNDNPHGQGYVVIDPQNELFVYTPDRKLQTYDPAALSPVIRQSNMGGQNYFRAFAGDFFGTGQKDVVIELRLTLSPARNDFELM